MGAYLRRGVARVFWGLIFDYYTLETFIFCFCVCVFFIIFNLLIDTYNTCRTPLKFNSKLLLIIHRAMPCFDFLKQLKGVPVEHVSYFYLLFFLWREIDREIDRCMYVCIADYIYIYTYI